MTAIQQARLKGLPQPPIAREPDIFDQAVAVSMSKPVGFVHDVS